MSNHIRTNKAEGYAHNKVAGDGMAGTRHTGGSQDAFWSSKEVPSEVVHQLGELYLFSDGVTHCADGHVASQLAVQTVRKHYYGQRPTHDLTPTARLTRLQEAVWQAHRQLARWDEKFCCWQKEAHPERDVVIFSRQALEKRGRFNDDIAICPLCNEQMDGLLATLLAIVIHEQHLFLVGIGDSFALHIPADPKQLIKSLHKQKNEFLGSPALSYSQSTNFPYIQWKLKAGDLIVLCCDGVAETLQALTGRIEWDAYLRQQLTAQNICEAVPNFIKSLHDYRTNSPHKRLNDDLTMLAVAMRGPQKALGSPSADSTAMVRSDGAARKAERNAPQVAKSLSVARLSTRQKTPLAINYAGEAVGGHGVAGSRHDPPAQDAFWPSPEAGLSPEVLSRLEMLLAGRLYLLADGVTLCADGYQASHLAAQTVGASYYTYPGHVQDSSRERKQRLAEAIWQAHLKVQGWDEKFFCWRKQYHPPQHFTKKEIRWRNGQPICPLCGHVMAGLQTTLVAAVLRGRQLTLVTVGDSTALRLPANPNQPLEFLANSKEKNFVGMPGLLSEHLYKKDFRLQPGDRLLLCGDGVIETLTGLQKKTGQNWHTYLRQRLNTPHLEQEVKKIINELHAFRLEQAPHLDDDLTLLAVAIPNESELIARREQVKRHSDELNHLLQASVIQPDLYANFINALEAALLHEDEENLWLQYGAALRERALAQVRKVGMLNDAKALTEMAQAVRAGDPEARRWQMVMKIAQQIAAWRNDKKSLLATSMKEHERVTNALATMKLVQTLPEVLSTLRSSSRRIARALEKAGQQTTATYYHNLLQQWDAAIEAMRSDSGVIALPPMRRLALPEPSTARPTEKEWLFKIYQDLITQLEQKNWLAAIALADDNLLYQGLSDPSADTIRNGILLLRSYEELAAQESKAAQNSLARIHKEFSQLLKSKFELEIEAFDAQNPPTIDQLLERLVGELKGRTPVFASHKAALARRPQTDSSDINNNDDEDNLITRLSDPSSTSEKSAPLQEQEDQADGQTSTNQEHSPLDQTEAQAITKNAPPPQDKADTPAATNLAPPPLDQTDASATVNLVRQAAWLAFQKHKLAEATQIMTEAAQNESTDKYMAKKDWKALWTDPAHRFKLRSNRSWFNCTLEQLVELLQMAKQIDQLFAQAITFRPSDNRIEEATTCWEKLQKFSKNSRFFNEGLPAEVGADRLDVVKKLVDVRVLFSKRRWKDALKIEWMEPASKHLRSAQQIYGAVVWRSFLGLESGVPQREVAANLLKIVKWLNDQYGWALVLEEAQQLKAQGKDVEAACQVVGMQIPKSLHSSERKRLVEWQRGFVYEAWELTLSMASGKYSNMNPSYFESAINALQEANLKEMPGSYASRMRAVEKLLPVAYYQQANDVVSAALAAQQIRKHSRLNKQENQQLLRIRQQRIDQVWQLALKYAAAPQSIQQEQRDDLHKAGDQLLGAQETALVAAGMLLAAALYFQADKRADAAKSILEAWQMVEGHQAKKEQVWHLVPKWIFKTWQMVKGRLAKKQQVGQLGEQIYLQPWQMVEGHQAKKQQVGQLAEQIYLQPWEKVRFWQVGRQRQLKQMRDLADQYGFRQVNPQLTKTLDYKMGRARNELMAVFAALALFLLIGAVAMLILGADATSAGTPGGSSAPTQIMASESSMASEVAASIPEPTHSPTPLPPTYSPTPLPPTEAISVVWSATPTVEMATSTLPPSTQFVPTTTQTAVPPTTTEPPARPTLSPWVPQAGPPLATPPVLIEMTVGQAGFIALDSLISYFGHFENAQVLKERSAIEALTPSYPQTLQPDTPLRGMLPADPLFLFVGKVGETQVSDDQKLGFELQFQNSAENIPNVLVNVPYTDAQDRDNKQRGLEIWRRDDRNWAWVLGSSQPLTDVLRDCRDSKAKTCPDQVAFVTGKRPINLEAVVLKRIENGQPAEFLLGNAGFENRWIYADLAKDGLQLMLSQDARNVIAEPQPGLGLVRASLQSNGLLVPSHILQRQKNDPKKGVYTRIGP